MTDNYGGGWSVEALREAGIVPDSDPQPLDPNMTFALPSNVVARYTATKVSGSGVVPDKPALAPDEQCGAWGGCPLPAGHNMGRVDIPEYHGVPAVTDDEAATALSDAICATSFRGPAEIGSVAYTARVVAALRSAGFLLVRDHTKET